MRIELTKRGDYAVRAMLALARAPEGGVVSARRIADAMDIPVRFLPQVLGDLRGPASSRPRRVARAAIASRGRRSRSACST